MAGKKDRYTINREEVFLTSSLILSNPFAQIREKILENS